MGNSLINNFVFLPPEPSYTKDKPDKVVNIKTKNGKTIPAYFLLNKKKVKTTIIYSHGNATDIGEMYDFLVLLRDNLPVNILHYEYIGYGLAKNQGSPSESSIYESVEAAFNFLLKRGIEEQNIIVFGTSVGSGPSCQIAHKKNILGLILECPFMSAVSVVIQKTNPLTNLVDMFRNIDKIDKMKSPVLLMHGRKDEVVPFHHGEGLWEKIPQNLKYKFIRVPNANHHDILEKVTIHTYIKTILDFIQHCQQFKNKKFKNNDNNNNNNNKGDDDDDDKDEEDEEDGINIKQNN